MSEVLTVELPDELARQARALATATNRRLEDAVLDWLRQAIAEPAVESLADDALLALCESTFQEAEQDELSDLLSRAREGDLDADGRQQLDHLMAAYRRGIVLKARAMKEASARGLRPPLADDAS